MMKITILKGSNIYMQKNVILNDDVKQPTNEIYNHQQLCMINGKQMHNF